MSQLSRYLKKRERPNPKIVTSINILETQFNWIEKHGLELSPIVRDLLEEFILKNGGYKK